MTFPRTVAALLLVVALPAAAQEPSLAPPLAGEPEAIEPAPHDRAGLPEIDDSCPGAEAFGGQTLERAGWCLMERARYVGLRRLASEALAKSPSSIRAHFLMGVAQHLGEGNLPKSLYHLNIAEQRFIDRWGESPSDAIRGPLKAYRRTLLELVYVHGEMDHHEEKIRYVDALDERLGVDYSPLKAWPLLKLKRFAEAKEVAEDALVQFEGGASYWQAVALTAICAIESEMRNRDAAYEACMAAAAPVMRSRREGGVAMSNAAAASIEVFRFAEAERLYIEATTRPVEGTINPWGRLTHLYLRQGRFPEAVSALRQMHRYRMRRPAYFDQQDAADAELTGAAVLLIAGRSKDAMRITERTVARPDRQGTSSAASEQNEAGNLLIDRAARLDVARALEEEASWSEWWPGVKLRMEAIELRLKAWTRGRRAATILSDEERLISSLRPECPGSVELPTWLDPELVRVVGSGATLAGLEVARAQETLPEAMAGPIFSLFEAEALHLRGDHEEALAAAANAIANMMPTETLLRSRAHLIAAESSRALGRTGEAVGHYEAVLMGDPGLIRRLGATLPVRIAMSDRDPATQLAADHLRSSPRFEEADWGFELALGKDTVALTHRDGTELLRARVISGKAHEVEAFARRIAKSAHTELLVPKVDITQADVRSLDGGMTGGGRASERVKSILEEVVE